MLGRGSFPGRQLQWLKTLMKKMTMKTNISMENLIQQQQWRMKNLLILLMDLHQQEMDMEASI
jgi:hypothetical protein